MFNPYNSQLGEDVSRLDYATPSGTKSLYNVVLTDQDKTYYFLQADQVSGEGGDRISVAIARSVVTEVYL